MTLPWLAHVQLATTLFGKSALCDVTKITDTSPRLLTTQQGVGSAHFAPRAPCFFCSTCKHVQGGREHSFLAGDWKHGANLIARSWALKKCRRSFLASSCEPSAMNCLRNTLFHLTWMTDLWMTLSATSEARRLASEDRSTVCAQRSASCDTAEDTSRLAGCKN